MKIFLIILTIILVSCKDDGGGVVQNTNEQPKTTTPVVPPLPPEFYGPFGGAINNDEVIPPPSIYSPPLTTFDLEQKIFLASEGSTVYLDSDYELNYSLVIDKSIILESAPGKRIKIIGKNLNTLIQTNSNNLSIKNMDFYLYNVEKFVISPVNAFGDPISSNLLIESNSFYLSGKSQVKILMNNTIFQNNTAFGLSSANRNFAIVDIHGHNLGIYANNIFDNTLKYQNGLLVRRSNNGNIISNRIISYAKGFYGSLSLSEVSNYNIMKNYLYDRNNTRIKNDGFAVDPLIDGSIAIAIELSHNVNDNNNTNLYYATHYLISDIGNNLPDESSNLNLNMTQELNDILPSQLFNHIETSDFTPICLVGTNPVINLNNIDYGKSYFMQNSLPLYYTGSIKPACL